MGDVSVRIRGKVEADEKYKMMKAVWDACEDADIDIPDDVYEYFEDGPPVENGKLVEVANLDAYNEDMRILPWPNDMELAFEVDLKKIPKGAKSLVVIINYD